MYNCDNKCGPYPYPQTNRIDPQAIVTFYQGNRWIGMTAQDFATSLELGLLNALPDFEDGDILMVQAGTLVSSGVRYDAELDAIVYDGRIIADEFETSNDTFQISERIGLAAFGTQLSINSIFDDTKSIPVFTKYDETGTLGIFQQVIGPEIPFIIQPLDDEVYTQTLYSPPDTVGGTASNAIRGRYRFAEAGQNVRIKTTATNQAGRELILFGTESYPYQNFVTKAYDGTPESETIVEYSGAIANEPGFLYETIIETYDPETNGPSTEVLKALGSQVNGEFRIYLEIDIQVRSEAQLQSGGNVIGTGTAQDAEIIVTDGASITNVKSSGIKLSDLVSSVTGDGVDNTDPTNPVLSFPDADNVDDSSTVNKFITQVEKDQIVTNQSNINTLQTAVTDNTQDITNNTAQININNLAISQNATDIQGVRDDLPKLYGHQGITSGNEFTTTSNVFQLVDTWTLNVDKADVYDIVTTVQWNLNDTGIDAEFRFDVNGVTVLDAEQEPKDTSNVIFLTTFGLVNLNQGDNTIELFARKSVPNGDVLTIFSNAYTARIIDVIS